MKRLQIKVPCSTSNLGPGFDLLGLALSLFVEVEAEELSPQGSQTHQLKTCTDFSRTWPQQGGLVERAFDAVFDAANRTPPPQLFTAKSQVPTARGLGSSGAAITAGLLLAKARIEELHGQAASPSPRTLLDLGIALEGHPDNVAASLMGGCTLCLPRSPSRATLLIEQAIAPSLGFAIAWGASTTSTEEARRVLPESVPFEDAVENPRRLAMLLEGLRSGDEDLLRAGAHDRLHHKARLALIPGGQATLNAAEEAGAWLVAISGSGSSLLAIGPQSEAANLADAMGTTLAEHDTDVAAHTLQIVRQAPLVAAY